MADSLAMSLMHAYTEASPLRNGLGLSSKIRWQPPPSPVPRLPGTAWHPGFLSLELEEEVRGFLIYKHFLP